MELELLTEGNALSAAVDAASLNVVLRHEAINGHFLINKNRLHAAQLPCFSEAVQANSCKYEFLLGNPSNGTCDLHVLQEFRRDGNVDMRHELKLSTLSALPLSVLSE